MYNNVHVDHALPVILEFLREHEAGKMIAHDKDIKFGLLEFAINLFMNNTTLQFGYTFWLQLAGTAMGTLSSPNYATLCSSLAMISLRSTLIASECNCN